MKAFEISQLMRERSNNSYLEFVRSASLSAGVYRLTAGASDPQQPHGEDELYYVLSGSASIRVGEEDREVRSGSVVYVEAKVEHRFHTITEDLTALVFFAPAEHSRAADESGAGHKF
ncbi:MAG TPA: cupin domain-containing protein [Blastocatellia bacterium]|jgi:mannose-6-phosphate isomerase-like protein (cupin superfamily)|nr:cupin domain-containing protein [Blastocatellia bacterium]